MPQRAADRLDVLDVLVDAVRAAPRAEPPRARLGGRASSAGARSRCSSGQRTSARPPGPARVERDDVAARAAARRTSGSIDGAKLRRRRDCPGPPARNRIVRPRRAAARERAATYSATRPGRGLARSSGTRTVRHARPRPGTGRPPSAAAQAASSERRRQGEEGDRPHGCDSDWSMAHPNSFDARADLRVGDRTYEIFRLDALQSKFDVARLPFSLKILLENLLRTEGNGSVEAEDIEALATLGREGRAAQGDRLHARARAHAGLHRRARRSSTSPRCATRWPTRSAATRSKINPLVPAELVIDHSVQVDFFGTRDAFERNAEREFERNEERYAFLRWGQGAFDDFSVVPPDTGIVHQVNIEYLARVVFPNDKTGQAYPDTLVGTDSHTTMVNGLGVLGWGVGGIEAEAAMLGQPMSMLIPQVLGFKLTGELPEGATATDLVLTVTEMLREKGVVGKFVEFYGHGLANLPLADRATIGNMSPEFGSTCAIFPIDAETLRYLEFTGRPQEQRDLVEAYAKEQGLWHDENTEDPTFSDTLELDLGDVVPSLAGPRRPQDRVVADRGADGVPRGARRSSCPRTRARDRKPGVPPQRARRRGRRRRVVPGQRPAVAHGARQRRRRARRRRRATREPRPLERRRRVTTAVAGDARRRHGDRARPRPRRHRRDHVVHEHLEPVGHARRRPARPQRASRRASRASRGSRRRWRRARWSSPSTTSARASTEPLEELGFHLVGYGCTTCIGNSGPLPEEISEAVNEDDLAVVSVLSRQPQLRGAHQPRREDELPRVAAARRRLRARRDDGLRPVQRPVPGLATST